MFPRSRDSEYTRPKSRRNANGKRRAATTEDCDTLEAAETRILSAEGVLHAQAKGGFREMLALRFGATGRGAINREWTEDGNLLKEAVTAFRKWMDGWANPAGDEQQRTSSRPELVFFQRNAADSMLYIDYFNKHDWGAETESPSAFVSISLQALSFTTARSSSETLPESQSSSFPAARAFSRLQVLGL